MTLHSRLAARTARMGSSAIRDILNVAAQPGMISLAGGMPAPESFPTEMLAELTARVLQTYGSQVLQYGPSEGFAPLRASLADYLGGRGVECSGAEILVTSGSQGALDALGMVLLSPGDRVAVEAPTYLGALQAFTPYEPEYVCLESDEEGLIPESLETALRAQRIRFIYLVPTFQNPTGRSMPLSRRRAVARLLQQHDTLLIEDDPYSALRYQGMELPAIQPMAPEHVVYVGTLSKVFAPGLRVGFCLAPPSLRPWLVIAKQGIDLHTSTFNQALAAEYLAGGHLQSHLPAIVNLYRPRQQAMLRALERYFPATFHWSRPQGGMFIWVEGPPGLDMPRVYQQALARGTAFVPGRFFYAHPARGLETMRLNFTNVDEDQLDQALRTLAAVCHEASGKDHIRHRPSSPKRGGRAWR